MIGPDTLGLASSSSEDDGRAPPFMRPTSLDKSMSYISPNLHSGPARARAAAFRENECESAVGLRGRRARSTELTARRAVLLPFWGCLHVWISRKEVACRGRALFDWAVSEHWVPAGAPLGTTFEAGYDV